MIPKLMRLMSAVGLIAMAGGLLGGGTLRADEPDQDNERPPQTLPQGFESTDQLLRDLEKAENAPLTPPGSSKAAGLSTCLPVHSCRTGPSSPAAQTRGTIFPSSTFRPMSESSRGRTATSPYTTAAGSSWHTSLTGTPRAAGGTSPTR